LTTVSDLRCRPREIDESNLGPEGSCPGVLHLPSRIRRRGGELLSANDAVTSVSSVTDTMHGPVPVQPPPTQPTKVVPESGIGVSVTAVPAT
jgi:hypothetical protein